MKDLSTKGAAELDKLKNRVSRLYGMNRIGVDDFNELNIMIQAVKEKIENVRETDGWQCKIFRSEWSWLY